VAGTRAKDLLVVSRSADPAKNKAWREFEGYLSGMPALDVSLAKPVTRKLEANLSAKARAAADAARVARHELIQTASWAVTSPTGEKARLAAASGDFVLDGARGLQTPGQVPDDAASRPDTPSHRADAGAAWGTLLHGLLEHAMRSADVSRDDLARLALWLTVEHEDIRPFISEALDVVDSVRQMPFWREAHAGAEVHVEVPFAMRALELGIPTVLRGVIDLVYLVDDGWRVLDYKSDQLDGMMDVDGVMLARYGQQLEQYRHAWQRVTGGKVTGAELVALRGRRTIAVR